MINQRNSQLKRAFSLMEISFVLLIVALLIAGVSQSVEIIQRSKLAHAKSFTNNSPVNSIDNLVAWYETSLKSSFDEDEREDEEPISTWYDISLQKNQKNNATQSNSTNQPVFYENVFNGGIPAVRFDGNDFMPFDGDSLVYSDFTIFVVEQRRIGDSVVRAFIGGTTQSINRNLILGYRNNNTVLFAQYGNDLDYGSIPSYESPIPRIHTFMLNREIGRSYWLNGGDSADISDSATNPVESYGGSAIGRYSSVYFNGDIAEIIIFNRALLTEERDSIEDYLSKKYNIRIQ